MSKKFDFMIDDLKAFKSGCKSLVQAVDGIESPETRAKAAGVLTVLTHALITVKDLGDYLHCHDHEEDWTKLMKFAIEKDCTRLLPYLHDGSKEDHEDLCAVIPPSLYTKEQEDKDEAEDDDDEDDNDDEDEDDDE